MVTVPLCCVLGLVCDCEVGLDGHGKQGMTQTKPQPGAVSSASTSGHSEEQVCKYCVQLVTHRVKGLEFSLFLAIAVSKGKFIANEHVQYILHRALEISIANTT